jgi:hypothetical protein
MSAPLTPEVALLLSSLAVCVALGLHWLKARR